MLVTHIQFPASRPRLPDVGCRSSSAPTASGHRLSRPPSRPRCLRIVLPAEERVPASAPRCLQGGRPVSQRSAGYNTIPDDASSDKLAAAGRKCRWGVLLRAVIKYRVGNSRPALCKCRPAAQIAIPYPESCLDHTGKPNSNYIADLPVFQRFIIKPFYECLV